MSSRGYQDSASECLHNEVGREIVQIRALAAGFVAGECSRRACHGCQPAEPAEQGTLPPGKEEVGDVIHRHVEETLERGEPWQAAVADRTSWAAMEKGFTTNPAPPRIFRIGTGTLLCAQTDA